VNRNLHRCTIAANGEVHIIAEVDSGEAARPFLREDRIAVDVRYVIAALEQSIGGTSRIDPKDHRLRPELEPARLGRRSSIERAVASEILDANALCARREAGGASGDSDSLRSSSTGQERADDNESQCAERFPCISLHRILV
jgi:hypothetical protein